MAEKTILPASALVPSHSAYMQAIRAICLNPANRNLDAVGIGYAIHEHAKTLIAQEGVDRFDRAPETSRRVTAVELLLTLGYTWSDGAWNACGRVEATCKDSLKVACWCETCRPITFADLRMVVCPDCGNKRCPHATFHGNACTGSNDPGQNGSSYERCANTRAQGAAPDGVEAVGEIVHVFDTACSRVVMFDGDLPIGTKLYTRSNAKTGEVDGWRERERLDLRVLKDLLRGFDVETERSPLQAPATYLVKVNIYQEFQPGDGQIVAEKLRNTLHRLNGNDKEMRR